MNYENRQFMILNTSELSNVDFTQILENSENSVRKSIDGTKTFVKWDGNEIPTSVNNLTSKEGPYNYSEMKEILDGIDWSNPNFYN
jgi:hypothetical protein